MHGFGGDSPLWPSLFTGPASSQIQRRNRGPPSREDRVPKVCVTAANEAMTQEPELPAQHPQGD